MNWWATGCFVISIDACIADCHIFVYLTMTFFRPLTIIIALLFGTLSIHAQSKMPNYFINADIGYAVQKMPMLGVEWFSIKNNHMRSWHVDLEYQYHYNDKFGIKKNKFDFVSVGVYQGPGVKVGYTFFTKWVDRKWKNYFSPTLGVKYLWYDKMQVNTDPVIPNPSFRLQSEKCLALVPQFYIGQKRYSKHICFDYYIGAQASVKFRDKKVYYEQNEFALANPKAPYNYFQIAMVPNFVFGVKLGYIKHKEITKKAEDDIRDQYRKKKHFKSNKKTGVFLFGDY